ncbi:hypothetical protein ABE504_25650 [Paenibacillus oryzisoli]|uniref:hypothetical protein n=1 Tax=Paenibacillus oryzisoli TaxID=1850517 RepID=UPI003D2B4AAB
MNRKSSSLFCLETAPVSAELENLQFISVIFGGRLPNGQIYWKKSSSVPDSGQNAKMYGRNSSSLDQWSQAHRQGTVMAERWKIGGEYGRCA